MTLTIPDHLAIPLNNLDIWRISPNRDPKFSTTLHSYLNKPCHPITRKHAMIYRTNEGELWLGYVFDGDFVGCRMNQVLTYGGKTSAATHLQMPDGLELVPDFWERYLENGIDAIAEIITP